MASRTVHVEGLREFRRAIKEVDRELGRELRQVHLKIAELVHGRAQAATRGAHAKKALKPKATQSAAMVAIKSNRGDELAVFFGAKRRSGWYAARRYRSSSGRQFKPWVGNQWDPGESAGKPYFIGDAINASIDEVIELYADGIEDISRKAFPEG